MNVRELDPTQGADRLTRITPMIIDLLSDGAKDALDLRLLDASRIISQYVGCYLGARTENDLAAARSSFLDSTRRDVDGMLEHRRMSLGPNARGIVIFERAAAVSALCRTVCWVDPRTLVRHEDAYELVFGDNSTVEPRRLWRNTLAPDELDIAG